MSDEKPSRCYGHPECRMTAGYYLGGGIWVCWLHALYSSTIMRLINKTNQPMKALPYSKVVEERNRHIQ